MHGDGTFDTIETALEAAVLRETPNVGTKLSNGGIILAAKFNQQTEWSQEWFVLSLVGHHFATWLYVVGVAQMASGRYRVMPPYCLYGDYTDTLDKAMEDFARRTF